MKIKLIFCKIESTMLSIVMTALIFFVSKVFLREMRKKLTN
jgi:hypothetical protein